MNVIQLAKAGYEAYIEMARLKNIQCAYMPKWDELPNQTQETWCSAARAIMVNVVKEITNKFNKK